MAYFMYVAIQGDNKISVFTLDPESGNISPEFEVPVDGGPFTLSISPDNKYLYVGCRDTPGISSYQINSNNGGLTALGSVAVDSWPVYISTDRKGKYLFSSYYQGAGVKVHGIAQDGSLVDPPVVSLDTATGAHAMQTDSTNSYAFVPHIAGNGPNSIYQFTFDENTGQIAPNTPDRVDPQEVLGPRHFCFHPDLDILYFSNEQGCSVSGYNLDMTTGTLSLFQTITTLPVGYRDRNTCSQIQISRAGNFLFAPNRGHDSIACFIVDTETGELKSNGIISSEPRPNALCLGPGDRYLYSAGQDSGNLATFKVDPISGAIDKIGVTPVGNGPCWISIIQLND